MYILTYPLIRALARKHLVLVTACSRGLQRAITVLLLLLTTSPAVSYATVQLDDEVNRWFVQETQSDKETGQRIGLDITHVEVTVSAPAECDMHVSDARMRMVDRSGQKTRSDFHRVINQPDTLIPKGTSRTFTTSERIIAGGLWDTIRLRFAGEGISMDCPGYIGSNGGTAFHDTITYSYTTHDGATHRSGPLRNDFNSTSSKNLRSLHASVESTILLQTLKGGKTIASGDTVKFREAVDGNITLKNVAHSTSTVIIHYDEKKGFLTWDLQHAQAGTYQANLTAYIALE
ncbi:hypothetical protein [Serratia ficaria]|uniref:hypothetical protein n=1 Tax=Serratia ficaria TaxID=61651 RepID=UPI00217C3800|nr:hypothetical protein [Serratia ficaria]CAI1508034.1 Uncharacterised protein [Serratia ficaria]